MTAAERKVRERYPGAWAYQRWRGGYMIFVDVNKPWIARGEKEDSAWADAASRLPIEEE